MVGARLDVAASSNDGEAMRFWVRGADPGAAFAPLARALRGTDVVCTLERDGPRAVVVARRVEQRAPRRFLSSPWVPRALFATVVAFVMIDGHYRAEATNRIVHVGDPLAEAAVYTAAPRGSGFS